jgi:hypothetical protein
MYKIIMASKILTTTPNLMFVIIIPYQSAFNIVAFVQCNSLADGKSWQVRGHY